MMEAQDSRLHSVLHGSGRPSYCGAQQRVLQCSEGDGWECSGERTCRLPLLRAGIEDLCSSQ